ncbi:MAG: ATP-binding protein, partial [Chloroflexota bacterium]
MAEAVSLGSGAPESGGVRSSRRIPAFRRPRLTLRDKIIGTIALAILVPVLIMGVFGTYTSEDAARSSAWNDAAIGGRAAQAIVDEQASQLLLTAQALALDPRYGDAIARGDSTALMALTTEAAYQLNGLDVTVTDGAGRVLIRTSNPRQSGDYLADALDGLRIALRGQADSTLEQGGYLGLALRGFAPIERDGRTIGAVITGRRANDDYLSAISHDTSLPSFALRPDGSSVGATVDPELARAVERSPGVYAGFGTVNGSLRAVYAWRFGDSVNSANSFVAVASPDLNLAQNRLALFWTTLAMVLLGILTTILLSWLFTRIAIRPIERISNAAREIAGGTGREIPLIATGDELEGLSRSLATMVNALSDRNQQLDRLHHRIELILSSAGDGIFDQGRDGNSTFVNLAAARLTGYRVDELVGQSMHELIHHSRADGTAYSCQDCPSCLVARDGQPRRTTDEVFWRKDGTSFPVEYTTTPIIEAGEVVGAVVTFRDVTERRLVEKMKDEFISVVSHELRTPLTSIRGSLGLLASGLLGDLPDRGKRMLEIAVKNTDRLVRLINDILDIERIESGRVTMDKRACDASDLVAQASDVMRSLADSAGVRLEAFSDNARLFVDSDRIIQVLTNLLSNAIKFSPEQGSVVVTGERRADGFWFRVTDQGRGIPLDKLETIFERFQQVDASDSREKGGAGLGLAICRSIVLQH